MFTFSRLILSFSRNLLTSYQTIDKVQCPCNTMEPDNNTTEAREVTVKSWMVEYTVEVDDESHRHLSMIRADDITNVHHHLLKELRKTYQTSAKVDVTVHRIEPITTNTDALYFEGIYAP